jgi:hypothetical protein
MNGEGFLRGFHHQALGFKLLVTLGSDQICNISALLDQLGTKHPTHTTGSQNQNSHDKSPVD